MRVAAVLMLLMSLASCAELIVRDHDPAIARAAKITVRVLLIIPTAGMSEGAMSEVKDREAYEAWRQRGVPEPLSPEQWRAYLFDEQLLRLSELVPDLILASWIGDSLMITGQMAAAAALFANRESPAPDIPHYPPPPLRRWNRALNDLPRLPCRPGPCAMP